MAFFCPKTTSDIVCNYYWHFTCKYLTLHSYFGPKWPLGTASGPADGLSEGRYSTELPGFIGLQLTQISASECVRRRTQFEARESVCSCVSDRVMATTAERLSLSGLSLPVRALLSG